MSERTRAVVVLCALLLLPAAAAVASPGGAGPVADLEMVATADPSANVAPGAPITYTLTVTNHGPDASGTFAASALIDTGTFLSGPPDCQVFGSFVNCVRGPLAPGASIELTVVFWTSGSPLIHNNAHIEPTVTDPNLANNHVFLTTTVVPSTVRQELAHGSRFTSVLHASKGFAGDTFRIRQQPYSSYEVVVDATSGDIGMGQGPSVELIDGGLNPLQAQPVGAGPSRTLRFLNPTASAIDGQEIRVRPLLGTFPNGGADDVYDLRAYDTTYAIPRFNNAGTQQTVLIVQNPTSRAVRALVWFWSEAGALLGTHEVLPLPAHGVLILDTSKVAGVAGQTGSVTIGNDAPYGTLTGKAVALETTTGYSFDTRMDPRPR